MTDELNPYQPPQSDSSDATPLDDAGYRPWSRGSVYMTFILGMHAAGFMMVFFHPVFAMLGLGFGIPAVLLANKEIDEFPQAAEHPFVKWGKIGGKIGVIGGPIVLALTIIVIAVAVGMGLSM